MDAECIISGGGIGGAVLAHLLARGGMKTCVLERSIGGPSIVRPEGLWPDTAAFLRTLLRDEKVGNAWVPLRGVRFFEGEKELLNEVGENFGGPGSHMVMTDPNQTREQLLLHGSFQVIRGIEVTGLLKSGERITGVKTRDVTGRQRELRAKWTIGDDGPHSRIRQSAGIGLKARIFPVEFMCFGFAWPECMPAGVAHVWLDKNRNQTGIVVMAAEPMPNGRGATMALVRGHVFDKVADKNAAWRQFLVQHPFLEEVAATIEFPKQVARIQRPWGHAERYGLDGVILVGDAAHPVSPVAGQGANMSVADARALAEILLSGRTDAIAEYTRRRRPANERSLEFTRRGAQLLGLPAIVLDSLLPFGLRWISSHPKMFARRMKAASQAFVELSP